MAGDGGGESSSAKFKRQMAERVEERKRRGDQPRPQPAEPVVLPPPRSRSPLLKSQPPEPVILPRPPNSVVARIAESVG